MIALIAQKLGLTQDRVATVIAAFIKSAWIMAGSFFIGLLVDAVSQGDTTPAALITYMQGHWLAWLVANILGPAYRGYEATQATLPAQPPKE